MSAQDLGKRLLAEIREENLDELIETVRQQHDAGASHRLGVGAIDRLLALSAGLSTSGDDSIQGRSRYDTGRNDEPSVIKRRSLPIIEITSPESGGGKQHLLYHITCIAVLPSHLHSIPIGGTNKAIIIVDTENRFFVPRLVQIMQSYISHRLAQARKDNPHSGTFPSLDNIDSTINSSLQHIHIFRPQSIASLLATLSNLQTYLFNPSSHFSSHRSIHSILLSSASTFIWSDRSQSDYASLPTSSPATTTTNNANDRPATTTTLILAPAQQSMYTPLATALQRTAQNLHCPLIYTTWNLSPNTTASSSTYINTNTNNPDPRRPRDRDGDAATTTTPAQHQHQHQQQQQQRNPLRTHHLPKSWPTLPTLILQTSRRPVRKFPIGTSAQEAMADATQRNEAVREGWFDVSVLFLACSSSSTSSAAAAAAAAAAESTAGNGAGPIGFEMRITGEGVEIID